VKRLTIAFLLIAVLAGPAPAQLPLRAAQQDLGFDQRLDAQVPADVLLRDESGRQVPLGEYLRDRPVVLVLAYYRCPGLCSLVLNGLTDALSGLPQTVGKEFTVLTVSFDPGDSAEMALAKKKAYLEEYARPGAADGWHFLTGGEREVKRLADAVGFRYRYDPKTGEYAHAAGILVLTPRGRVSRYLFGIQYAARDLRLALVEASEGKIGSPADQVLLFCLSYDPVTGKYRVTALSAVRIAAVVTALVLAALVTRALLRERRRRRLAQAAAPATEVSDAGRV
jgi:protein SCO1/2